MERNEAGERMRPEARPCRSSGCQRCAAFGTWLIPVPGTGVPPDFDPSDPPPPIIAALHTSHLHLRKNKVYAYSLVLELTLVFTRLVLLP